MTPRRERAGPVPQQFTSCAACASLLAGCCRNPAVRTCCTGTVLFRSSCDPARGPVLERTSAPSPHALARLRVGDHSDGPLRLLCHERRARLGRVRKGGEGRGTLLRRFHCPSWSLQGGTANGGTPRTGDRNLADETGFHVENLTAVCSPSGATGNGRAWIDSGTPRLVAACPRSHFAMTVLRNFDQLTSVRGCRASIDTSHLLDEDFSYLEHHADCTTSRSTDRCHRHLRLAGEQAWLAGCV